MTYSPIYTTVNYVQAKTGLSNTEVDLSSDNIVRMTIEDAENELEVLIGRKFTDANSYTEYININREDILGNKQTSFTLSNYPIQSITTLLELDISGNTTYTYVTLSAAQISAGTITTTDYWLETEESLNVAQACTGKVTLKVRSLNQGTQVIKAVYTYGYSTVPVEIRDLATCLAGIRCWVRFLGASYNRLNSYQIPQQVANKGDFYQRGQQNIQMLTDEANRLLDRIGRKPRTFFTSTGGSR